MPVSSARTRTDWQEAVSLGFVDLAIPSASEAFEGRIDYTLVASDLAISMAHASACVVERTSRMVDDSSGRYAIFAFPLGGASVLSQGNRRRELPARSGALITSDAPYRQIFAEDHHALAVYASLDRLGLTPEQAHAMATEPIGDETVGFGVLRGFLSALAQSWTSLPPEMRVTYGRTASDMLASMFWQRGRVEPGTDNSRRLLGRLKRFAIDNLDDPRLDVSHLARELGISTRTVHATFASVDASAADFIRRRRLERAASLLSESPAAIAEIAVAVGFGDPTTFTRAFKRRYGVTLAQWRQSTRSRRSIA